MLDIVSYFTPEGYLLGELTSVIPQYKLAKIAGKPDRWAAFELTSNGDYSPLCSDTDYTEAVSQIVARATNINRKKTHINWKSTSKDATDTYATNGALTGTEAMTVWSIESVEDYPELFRVMYHDGVSAPTAIFRDCLFGCQMFVKDPVNAVIERLVELYKMHMGLQLYRMIADLVAYKTIEMCSRGTLYDVVRIAINYSESWVRRAARIGGRFVNPDGRSTNLIREGVYDWNVTQLGALMQLEDGEIDFLHNLGLITSVMSGEEVCTAVRDYLKDPDHKLRREYLESCGR